MWRRFGDYVYAILVLVVFGVEASALFVLSLAFLARLVGLLPYPHLVQLLWAFVALTCVALAVVTMHVLVYCALSAYRERTRRARTQPWIDLFVAWMFDRSVAIPTRIPREGIDALLDLRETVAGEDGAALGDLIVRHGIAAQLMERAKSRRLARRLHAIEGLAKARYPGALDLAFSLLDDDARVVRFMATRVIARTLATFPASDDGRFAAALRRSDLPAGVIEEALLLLDDAAPSVIAAILTSEDSARHAITAALAALTRLPKADDDAIATGVARLVGHEDPEIDAAAMQCAAHLSLRTSMLDEHITRASEAPLEYVRVQATRALVLIEEERALRSLWDRLHDSSWWVRHAAAETLTAVGPRGVAELRRAREEHPDRFARSMAHQVLLDGQLGGAS